MHVDHEPGQTLVLGSVGIGAHDDLADVAVLGARRPHLLAVEHPLVAIAHGPALEAGEVGSGGGLAEELAADDVAPVHLAQACVLHLVGGVGEDRGRHHPEPDAEGLLGRRVEAGRLRLPGALVRRRQLPAPVLRRARDPPEAGVEDAGLPLLGLAHLGQLFFERLLGEEAHFVVALTPRRGLLVAGLRVGLEEGVGLGAELVFGDGVGGHGRKATRGGRLPACPLATGCGCA